MSGRMTTIPTLGILVTKDFKTLKTMMKAIMRQNEENEAHHHQGSDSMGYKKGTKLSESQKAALQRKREAKTVESGIERDMAKSEAVMTAIDRSRRKVGLQGLDLEIFKVLHEKLLICVGESCITLSKMNAELKRLENIGLSSGWTAMTDEFWHFISEGNCKAL